MADREVTRVVPLIPASVVDQIRQGFHLPEGVASRRSIGASVAANVQRYAPHSMKRGELSEAAGKYLLDWSSGCLDQIQRPSHYSVLHRRLEEFRDETIHNGIWSKPSRYRHIDLTIAGPEVGDSESDSEGPVDLPPALVDA